MKKIVALVPNMLGVSPGQRLRIESWAKNLTAFGWEVEFYPFEDEQLHEIIYVKGSTLAKAVGTARCYLKQTKSVLSKPECDVVLIYREASLIGPAILERLAKTWNVPIVYDIDDPIFLPYNSPVNGSLSKLKFSRKTHSLFKFSNHVISINDIIGNYAKKFNQNVTVVPNFVDTSVYKPSQRQEIVGDTKNVRIGWTGSVSTIQNLEIIQKPLQILQEKFGTKIRLIANGKTEIKGVELEQKTWSAEMEVPFLQECDIGIVPLLDLEWNPWKFYLKTIQYMAVGLPVVAHKMGSNAEVIQDGVNGFVVETEAEWTEKLSLLIENPELRIKMGKEARKSAIEKYSTEVQMPRVAKIFEEVYEKHKSNG
jgi:glycosyltransferase involved in cell wall biosynthesis